MFGQVGQEEEDPAEFTFLIVLLLNKYLIAVYLITTKRAAGCCPDPRSCTPISVADLSPGGLESS